MRSLSADLSDWEVDEALCDLRAGATIEAVAARYGISERTMTRIVGRARRREEEEEMAERNGNALRRVNDALIAELDRLEGIGADEPDALRLEISRAKAIEGIAHATNENANTILSVARIQAERAGDAHVPIPRMLVG